jgi:hypothetical protein
LLINICLTILGCVLPLPSSRRLSELTCRVSYFPGHIHAFYLEYQYYKRRDEAKVGIIGPRAPGVYSDRIQRGGGYGTIAHAAPAQPPVV